MPDKLGLVNMDDGSVTWLSTGMLTAEESISAEQLGLNSVDIQVIQCLFNYQLTVN